MIFNAIALRMAIPASRSSSHDTIEKETIRKKTRLLRMLRGHERKNPGR